MTESHNCTVDISEVSPTRDRDFRFPPKIVGGSGALRDCESEIFDRESSRERMMTSVPERA